MTSVTVERDGAVAAVVLPGPALSLAVKKGLLESLLAVAADDQVRAVVLAGTGRAFCVGQDLTEHAAALEADAATASTRCGSTTTRSPPRW
jgi:2-(1,2-epoxy-1,2-dihydrophenyl)acetyl-CoA isomerase